MRKTALSLRLKRSDVQILQAPISGFGTSPTKQSIDIVDQKKLKELAKALQTDEMDKYVAKVPAGLVDRRLMEAAVRDGLFVYARRVRRTKRALPFVLLALLVGINAYLIALLLRPEPEISAEPAAPRPEPSHQRPVLRAQSLPRHSALRRHPRRQNRPTRMQRRYRSNG